MFDEVERKGAQALGGTVDGVDDGDGLLDAVAFGVVESGGELVGGGVESLFADVVGHGDLDEPGLEVDGDGGAVLDGAGEVVDVDVVAEDGLGVALSLRDGRPRERDAAGVGEGVGEVAGVAVEVVIVAAVGLVDDDDDVGPFGEHRVGGAGVLLGLGAAELLQGGEVDAAGRAAGELVAELFAANDLPGLLREEQGA